MELFRRRLAAPLSAATAAVLGVLLLFAVPRLLGVPILQALEATTFDLRLHVERRLRPVPVTKEIVIVGIDDQSLATHGRWPWPRQLWADVIDALVELGVQAVFLDISFPDPAVSSVQTRDGKRSIAQALGDSIEVARRVVDVSSRGSPLSTGAAAALEEGFTQLKNQVAGFLPPADEVVAESLELARRQGVVTGGVLTAQRDEPVPHIAVGEVFRKQALALFAEDISPDLTAAPEGVRTYAHAHMNDLREEVLRTRTIAALGGRKPDEVDARALYLQAIPESYREAGPLGFTIFEQVLSEKLIAARHMFTPATPENAPGLIVADDLLLPTFTIARSYGVAGVDTELKDIDGKYRSVPVLWKRPEGMLPTAGLALYARLAAAKAGALPAMRLEPGPALVIERNGAAALKVPLAERGEMLVHWAGGWRDTFAQLPAGALLDYAEKRRARERWFERRAMGQAYGAALAFRDTARSLWARDAGARPDFAALARAVAGRFPGQDLPLENLQRAKLEGVPATAAEPRAITDWLRILSAYQTWVEKDAIETDRARAALIAKIADPAKRAERQAKNAAAMRAFEVQVAKTEALRKELVTRLAGRICFIGHVASSSTDLASTPFQKDYPKVGSHASVLNTLFQERFLSRPEGLQLPILVLVCIALAFVVAELSSAQGFMVASAFGLLWVAATTALFIYGGVWLDVVAPILGSTITYVAVVTLRNRRTEKIRSMFESYVDPNIVQVVVDDENLWTELGGREAKITAYFSDIAGFTTLSELLSAHEVSEMLTDYLSPMTDIILHHEGTRDKYIGDAIVAFFGAPLPIQDHELKACLAAIEQQERLIELKKQWLADGRGWYRKILASGTDLTFRVGLNSGLAKVGNFGSAKSKSYTMIGDTVNLASRLEGANKEYGTLIMAARATTAPYRDRLVTRELDRLVVKGKLEAVKVYEVIGRTGAVPGLWDRVLDLYNTGLDFYHRREFAKALEVFQKLLVLKSDDGPAQVYAARAQAFLESPPPENWDGMHRMTHK